MEECILNLPSLPPAGCSVLGPQERACPGAAGGAAAVQLAQRGSHVCQRHHHHSEEEEVQLPRVLQIHHQYPLESEKTRLGLIPRAQLLVSILGQLVSFPGLNCWSQSQVNWSHSQGSIDLASNPGAYPAFCRLQYKKLQATKSRMRAWVRGYN